MGSNVVRFAKQNLTWVHFA